MRRIVRPCLVRLQLRLRRKSRTKRPFGAALLLQADGRAGALFHGAQAEPAEPQIAASPAPAPAPASRGALPNEALVLGYSFNLALFGSHSIILAHDFREKNLT